MEHKHMIDISKDFEKEKNDELNWRDIEISPDVNSVHQYENIERSSASIPTSKNWSLRNDEAYIRSSRPNAPYFKKELKEANIHSTDKYVESLHLLNEKNWKYKVPLTLAKKFAKAIHADDPDFEEIRDILKEIVAFVQKAVGEDNFYEEDLLDDLEYADLETEDDVDYYINEMYDVLDGYDVWMEPASWIDIEEDEEEFEESKMREAKLTENSKDPYKLAKKYNLDVFELRGIDVSNDLARTTYITIAPDHRVAGSWTICLTDTEEIKAYQKYHQNGNWLVAIHKSFQDYVDACDWIEQNIDRNDTLEGDPVLSESKLIENLEDEEDLEESKKSDLKRLKYLLRKEEVTELDKAEKFEIQDLLKAYGYPGDLEESKIRESSKGKYAKKFEALIKAVGLDKSGAFEDEEVDCSDSGFLFDSQAAMLRVAFNPETEEWEVYWQDYEDGSVLADRVGKGFNNLIDYLFSLDTAAFMYTDAKASDFYIKDPISFKELYNTFMSAVKDWEEPGQKVKSRIKKFGRDVIAACRLKDDEMLKKIAYEYSDIQDAVPPLYSDLIDHLGGDRFEESLVHDTLDVANDELDHAKRANFYMDTTTVEDDINQAQGAIRKVKAITESGKENTKKLREAEDFDVEEFEAMIPHNMRFKIWEDYGDLLYWVTQEDFNKADLEDFQWALKETPFKSAYVIVRDCSSYDKREDIESDMGYLVPANGSIF